MLNDPFEIFVEWFADASKSEPEHPNAMSLATVSVVGIPDIRIVLLKSFDSRGFVFFTNYKSKKSKDIDNNSVATVCFHWKSLSRQVRISGQIEKVSENESDEYFQTRSRMSQIGAWASIQSFPIIDEFDFETRIVKYTMKFNVGDIPRPDFWGGYRLVPNYFEFWQERPFRLHDRGVFKKNGNIWLFERLYP
jgi:pyridoxamine 5'-phosphate oxidase